MKSMLFKLFALATVVASLCIANEGAPKPPTTEVFENVRGGEFRLSEDEKSLATVLVFFGHDCPISNGYAPEIKRLYEEFQDRKVAFCLVYADADVTVEEATKHAKEYGFECAAILDPKLTLARFCGATIKPEVAVLSRENKLLYRGRIDDRYVDFGKQRAEPKVRELRDALQAVVAGKPIAVTRSKALGCDIDFDAPAK